MATLKFNNLQKIYPNNVQAVFDFNLEIKDKEFIVFVGPSGCGKSTTLRMVAGLEEISDGELFIDNKLVNFVDPKFRDIAMVFQSYALYPHMTVYNNIAFSLKIRKADMPVYEESEELKSLQEALKANRIKFLRINKKLAKKPNDENLIAEQKSLKEEAFKLFADIKNASKPVVAHSNLLAKRWSRNVTKCNKEIKSLTSKISRLSEAKNVDSHYLNSLKIELSSKEKELLNAEKEAEFYAKNDTNLVKFRHYTKNEIYEAVLNAADILDLFVYLERKPAALSGGQRQRVALGRAIVRKPKVFLMDEPLSNLDAKLRTQTRSEIAQIHKSVGATTIYVTHDQVEAMTLADRIVIMKAGYIQQVATPKEAFEKPANMFVGGFIGSPAMNFIKGTFDGKDFIIPSDNEKSKPVKINLTKEIIANLANYKGKEIFIGIRPEFVHLKDEYNEKSEVAEIELPFKQFELVGHEFILYFKVNGQPLSAKAKSDENLEEGKKYKFVIQLDKVHFFDPETTNRI